jgi:hypothetical protein
VLSGVVKDDCSTCPAGTAEDESGADGEANEVAGGAAPGAAASTVVGEAAGEAADATAEVDEAA